MLLAQVQQAYENLPPEQTGDEGMFLFVLLSEIGVTALVFLIIYYIIVKPQKDKRKQEEEAKKNQNEK